MNRLCRYLLMMLVGALLTTACGGGGNERATKPDPVAVGLQHPSRTKSAPLASSAAGPAASPSGPGVGGEVTAPTVGSSQGSSGPLRSEPSASKEALDTPEPAAPGTYMYRQSGSATFGSTRQPVPAHGTMVVDPAERDGTSQTWHRYVDTNEPPTDIALSFSTSGVFITTEVQRVSFQGQSMTITCTFPKPGVPAPPWPPAVGKTFSDTGNCGSFTATVTGQIEGQTSDTVGSQTFAVYILKSTLTTHGQVQLTAIETDWVAYGLRLPVHIQTDVRGTYALSSFTSDTTADLESLTPG